MAILKIHNLKACVGTKPILDGVTLEVRSGEIHALMGPNGSGKSTLAHVLMGAPGYEVTGGSVTFDGQDLLAMEAHERALCGLFLAFQYPVEIPGLTVGKFLKRASELRSVHANAQASAQAGAASHTKSEAPLAPQGGAIATELGRTQAASRTGLANPTMLGSSAEGTSAEGASADSARSDSANAGTAGLAGPKVSASGFLTQLRSLMDFMEIDQGFINRYLNAGFSGGEKKRMEVLQMLVLQPTMAILDETDSGLDIDALKIVSKGVNRLRTPAFGALVITHYRRILEQVKPDYVHVMYQGKIAASGGQELIEKLEAQGYDWLKGLSQPVS